MYWNGVTTEAGASFSERLTSTCAPSATTPSRARSAASRADGGTQPSGASAAPAASAPALCQNTSDTSGTPRSARPVIIISAKQRLPAAANRAAGESVAAVGPSATSTPTNPTRMAVQRRQPRRSPRSQGERAAT